ncbi:FadR/GntR family transcriptional regulator [Liberiplasma polymorphum]|uniref:FadR/GntR family transcriptional regulator n=1 Tax=Liberiplasma polymorphum TaxID=3374570 RepID=UPI0037728F6B
MKKKQKSQIVYDYIEELVISGEIKPGERLPSEAKLCEILNVSRVSVRAGIEKLSAIGLVKKKKGGGTYVNKPNNENYLSVFTPTLLHNTDYLELLEIRRALDSLSVALCAKNITESGVRKLQAIIEEMEHLEEDDDFLTLDKKFHLLISKYSKNRFLHNIHIIMWDVIQKALRENYNKVTNYERIKEHRQIYDAIVHKDEDLARIYTVRHLEEIIDTFVCEYNLESQYEAIKKQKKS